MDKRKEPTASPTQTPATQTRSRRYLSRETLLGFVVSGSFIALVGGVVAMKTFLTPPQSNEMVQTPAAQPPEPSPHEFQPIPIPAGEQQTTIVTGTAFVPPVYSNAPDPALPAIKIDAAKPMAEILTVNAESPVVVDVPPAHVVAPMVLPIVEPSVVAPPDAPKTERVVVMAPPEQAPVKPPADDTFQAAVKEPGPSQPGQQRVVADKSIRQVSNDSTAAKMDDPEKKPPPPDAPPIVPPAEAEPAPAAPPILSPIAPDLKIDTQKTGNQPEKAHEQSDAQKKDASVNIDLGPAPTINPPGKVDGPSDSQKKKDSSINIDLGPAPTINAPANVEPPADTQKKVDSPAVVAPPADSPPKDAPNLKLNLPKKLAAPTEPKATQDTTAPASLNIAPKTAEKKDNEFEEDFHSPKQDESYRAISKQYYNSEAYSTALQRYNQDHPNQLGKVRIPPIWVLEKNYASDITASAARPVNYTAPPAVAAPRNNPVYVVSENGEMLADIARKQLGSEDAWRRIWDLNPQLNPAKTIAGGTRLLLPGQ